MFEDKSIFKNIPYFPMDQIERTNLNFTQDKSSNKIYLGSGELQNEENKTYQFEVVKKAEEKLYQSNEIFNKEYLFPQGDEEYCRLARDLCLGTRNIPENKKIFSIQTQGATGAIRLAFNFLKKFMDNKMYIPCPTWPLAKVIAEEVGLNFEEVDFFDVKNQQMYFDNLLSKLKNAENKSLLFMQDIANSPTGEDPSMDQWKQLIDICKDKQIRVFLDSAFQGYASGDLESDSEVVKLFLKEDLPFFVAQTFSKNLGVYGERIGCLHVVCHSSEDIEKIKSQLEHRARCLWLCPSKHGSLLVKTILKDKELMSQWKEEFKKVQIRLREARKMLQDALIQVGAQGPWQNLTKHCGLFVQLPMNKKQIDFLRDSHHLYTVDMGRINISSINRNDIQRVAQGIKEALELSQQ
jgi:aspartate/tyrosine/aromatic aminotransferase